MIKFNPNNLPGPTLATFKHRRLNKKGLLNCYDPLNQAEIGFYCTYMVYKGIFVI